MNAMIIINLLNIIFLSVFSLSQKNKNIENSFLFAEPIRVLSLKSSTAQIFLDKYNVIVEDTDMNDFSLAISGEFQNVFFSKDKNNYYQSFKLTNSSLFLNNLIFNEKLDAPFACMSSSSLLQLENIRLMRNPDVPLVQTSSSIIRLNNITFISFSDNIFEVPLIISSGEGDEVYVSTTSFEGFKTLCCDSFICTINTKILNVKDCQFKNISFFSNNISSSKVKNQQPSILSKSTVVIKDCSFICVINPFYGCVYDAFLSFSSSTSNTTFEKTITDHDYSKTVPFNITSNTLFSSCSFTDCSTESSSDDSLGGGAIFLITSSSSSSKRENERRINKEKEDKREEYKKENDEDNSDGLITLGLENCDFYKCIACHSSDACGGACFIKDGYALSSGSQSVYFYAKTCIFKECYANCGGGGMMIGAMGELDRCEFLLCKVGKLGGGILFDLGFTSFTPSSSSLSFLSSFKNNNNNNNRNTLYHYKQENNISSNEDSFNGCLCSVGNSSFVRCYADKSFSNTSPSSFSPLRDIVSGSGGAVGVISLSSSSQIKVMDCYLMRNKAIGGEGGCFFLCAKSEEEGGFIFFINNEFMNSGSDSRGKDISATEDWLKRLTNNSFDNSKSLSDTPKVTIRLDDILLYSYSPSSSSSSSSLSSSSYYSEDVIKNKREKDKNNEVVDNKTLILDDFLPKISMRNDEFALLILILVLAVIVLILLIIFIFCCVYYIPRKEKKARQEEKLKRMENEKTTTLDNNNPSLLLSSSSTFSSNAPIYPSSESSTPSSPQNNNSGGNESLTSNQPNVQEEEEERNVFQSEYEKANDEIVINKKRK